MVIIDRAKAPSSSPIARSKRCSATRPRASSARKWKSLLPERFRARHIGHRAAYVREHARAADGHRARPLRPAQGWHGVPGRNQPESRRGQRPRRSLVAAIRDITERREIQNALREAREGADRANNAKSRFLATASHDLRQPLQALSLLNGTMRRMVKDGPIAEALAQEEQAISAMSRLLNALLDISKLESGAIKPEITDFKVAALFEEMRTEFAALAANKGLRLEVEECDGSRALRSVARRPGGAQPRGERHQVHERGSGSASVPA